MSVGNGRRRPLPPVGARESLFVLPEIFALIDRALRKLGEPEGGWHWLNR